MAAVVELPSARVARPGQRLFRHAFVPCLLAATAYVWLRHAELDAYLHRARWGVDPLTLELLAALAVVWLAEQLYPARPEWNYNVASDPVRGLNRFARDFFYVTFGALLNGLATGGMAKLVAAGMARLHLDALRAIWPSTLPFAARALLAFLVVELFSYAYHRAAHRFELLWGFHSTHHVIGELTGVKALRTHPVDNALFYIPRMVPLLLLGAGVDEVLAATYFGCVLGILSHANLDLAETGLGWFINFPGYHAVHHSSALAESNSNFGCHTVLWDRIFRTFRSGAPTAALGVNPVGERTLWQELVWPMYRSVAISASDDRR